MEPQDWYFDKARYDQECTKQTMRHNVRIHCLQRMYNIAGHTHTPAYM